MANSANLNLEPIDLTSAPSHYTKDLESERVVNANKDKLDTFVGGMTGSMFLTFHMSGAISDKMATDDRILGVHYITTPITWKQIIAYASHSGSGGVTSIDIQQQETVGGGFQTIFANAADRPNVSSSLGDYGVASGSIFRTGSCAAGLMVRAVITSAAGASVAGSAQRNLTCELFYKPT